MTAFATPLTENQVPEKYLPKPAALVRITASQLKYWFQNWPQHPLFKSIDCRRDPAEIPSAYQNEEWALEMRAALNDLAGATLMIRGKSFTVVSISRCDRKNRATFRADTPLINSDADWTISFELHSKSKNICVRALFDEGMQFLELPAANLTHPFWITHRLTLNGVSIPTLIHQDTLELSIEVRESLLRQVGTELSHAGAWSASVAELWTAWGPRLFLDIRPTGGIGVFLVAYNRKKPDHGKTCTKYEWITTDVLDEQHLLPYLRQLAWTWVCALAAQRANALGPYSLWIQQKNDAYWAFEPFTLHALKNGLQILLVAKTPELDQILALAPPSSLVSPKFRPLKDNDARVVFPFHLQEYWAQVTTPMQAQLEGVSFKLRMHPHERAQLLECPATGIAPSLLDPEWEHCRTGRVGTHEAIAALLQAHQQREFLC